MAVATVSDTPRHSFRPKIAHLNILQWKQSQAYSGTTSDLFSPEQMAVAAISGILRHNF